MSLQSRLAALIAQIGADIKANDPHRLASASRVQWKRVDGSNGAYLLGEDVITGAKKDTDLSIILPGEGNGETLLGLVAQADGAPAAQITMDSEPLHPSLKRRIYVSVIPEPFGSGSSLKVYKLIASDGSSDWVLKAKPGDLEQVGEAWRKVGLAGNPAFSANWGQTRDISNGNYEYVAFYKDPLGIVHVKGSARATAAQAADGVIFQLPPGYRPNRYENYPTTGACKEVYLEGIVAPAGAGSPGGIRIATAMAINTNIILDGISFRAGDGTGA